MIAELELEVSRMRTRFAEKSEGESIPFTKKELEKSPFTRHTIQANIHYNNTNQIQSNYEIKPSTSKDYFDPNTDEIHIFRDQWRIIVLEHNNNTNDISSSNLIVNLSQNLLQKLKDLIKDQNNELKADNQKISTRRKITQQNKNQFEDDSNENENNHKDIDDDNEDDELGIDKTFNQLNTETDEITNKQNITRTQKFNVINNKR